MRWERTCPKGEHKHQKCTFLALSNEYESASEDSDVEDTLEGSTKLVEDLCGPDLASDMPKLALVARRALSIKLSYNGKRDQLFNTRVVMGNTSLSVIIDSGSCANFISRRVVDHFRLPVTVHPAPFQLQWISSHGGKWVNHQ